MAHLLLFVGPLELPPLAIGLIVTLLIFVKRAAWIKVAISLVAFFAVGKAFHFAGIHKCLEGRPPELLGYLFGFIAGMIPWALAKWRWSVPVAFIAVGLTGATVAKSLANSYHRPDITGNPAYSSGRFWHSPLTGQLPRDPAKMHAYPLGGEGRR